MPKGLGVEGQKLWKGVVQEFVPTTADPDKVRILFDASRTADLVKRLDDAAAKAPLTVRGSMGQAVIKPADRTGPDIADAASPTASPTQLHSRRLRRLMAAMRPTRRRNAKPKSTPGALAERLPLELRSFKSFTDPTDLGSHLTAVADWLNHAAPGLEKGSGATDARQRSVCEHNCGDAGCQPGDGVPGAC